MARRRDAGKGHVRLQAELASYISGSLPEGLEEVIKLRRAWEQICSQQALNHTDNLVYSKRSQGTVVVVYLDDSRWASELSMNKEILRLKLSQALQTPIDDMVFSVNRRAALKLRFQKAGGGRLAAGSQDLAAGCGGAAGGGAAGGGGAPREGAERPASTQARVTPIPLSEEEEGHTRKLLNSIKDEKLRNSLYRAIKSSAEWKKGIEGLKSSQTAPESPE